ncbi:MAG: hypothetical protein WC852_02675 [Candidatus Nanoarchaeia archaeon]|jgi:hypothetical protein
MSNDKMLEERIAAACNTFRIPDDDIEEFASTVLSMLDAIKQSGLEYGVDECRLDFDAYTGAVNDIKNMPGAPAKEEQAQLAAFTAGYISAVEYCYQNPLIRAQFREQLLKRMRN